MCLFLTTKILCIRYRICAYMFYVLKMLLILPKLPPIQINQITTAYTTTSSITVMVLHWEHWWTAGKCTVGQVWLLVQYCLAKATVINSFLVNLILPASHTHMHINTHMHTEDGMDIVTYEWWHTSKKRVGWIYAKQQQLNTQTWSKWESREWVGRWLRWWQKKNEIKPKQFFGGVKGRGVGGEREERKGRQECFMVQGKGVKKNIPLLT